MNIPIFRAKKIDSGEYIEGICVNDNLMVEYIFQKNYYSPHIAETSEIDLSTLSIHFPNMLAGDSNDYDSTGEKDLRVFASLQEFGKGGDIITDGEYDFVPIFNGRSFNLMFVGENTFTKVNEWDDWNNFTKKNRDGWNKFTKKDKKC